MTGWGQEGPLALRAGHDINYIAMTGALHAIGERDAPPAVPLNLVGDYGGGTMFLALGMVSAILAARTTGKGQVVDAAMVDGAANLMSLFYAFLSTGQWKDQRHSNLLDGSAPFYRCYTCRDGGHVAVGALEPQFFAILLEGLGINADEFDQNDPHFWPVLEARFTETLASRTRDEWEGTTAYQYCGRKRTCLSLVPLPGRLAGCGRCLGTPILCQSAGRSWNKRRRIRSE